jgi:hypothetical protein
MSQEAVERILGRMITDENFRRQAVDSLEIASTDEGYRLTPIELRMLTKLEMSGVTELAGRLDAGLCRV